LQDAASRFSVDAGKFALPVIGQTVRRAHLEERLAEGEPAVRWFFAPAGSGKTTLVGQYARGFARTVWYRVDARDNALGFFAAHLVALLSKADCAIDGFPPLHDTDRGREQDFTRRFAASFWSAVPAGCLIVFDDAHRLESPAALQLLEQLVVLNRDIRMLLVAEAAPPPALFNLIAHRQMAVLGDVDLKFSNQECDALASLLKSSPPPGARLHEVTSGHAAALVLAIELTRRGGLLPEDCLSERAYGYLLDSLLSRLQAQERRIVRAGGVLRHFDAALLQDCLCVVDAQQALDTLVGRGLLHRHGETADQYAAHQLVCRAVRALLPSGDDELAKDARACAHGLERAGRWDEAFELWCDLAEQKAASLALQQAAVAHARTRNVELMRSSAARLQPKFVHGNGWLCFWLGQGELGLDEAAARQWFERAYEAFDMSGDKAGQAVAVASVLVAFEASEFAAIASLPIWMDRFAPAGAFEEGDLDAPIRNLLALGVLAHAGAAAAEQVDMERLQAARNVVAAALDDPGAWPTPDQRLIAAWIMINVAMQYESRERAKHVALAAERIGRDASLSPLGRIRYWINRAWLHALGSETPQRDAAVEQAEQIRQQAGLSSADFEIAQVQTAFALRDGRIEEAEQRLAELEASAGRCGSREIADAGRLAAAVLLLADRRVDALARAEAAMEHALHAGYTRAHARLFEHELANALAANGRAEEASQRCAEMAALQTARERDIFELSSLLYRALASGCRDLAVLSQALRRAAELQYYLVLMRLPRELALLCEAALEAGIETDYVRELIRRRELRPVHGVGPSWPWPVRVRLVGGFQLEVGQHEYRPEHKAQGRPLDLVKLLAVGPLLQSAPLERRWLAQQLWPDAESERALKSLDMTVSRLRRLLGDDACVDVTGGQVRLNDALVFTDVRRILWAVGVLSAARDDFVTDKPVDENAMLRAFHAVGTAGGELLAAEAEWVWLVNARRRFAGRIDRALLGVAPFVGGSLREAWRRSAEGFFEADPTNEELVRVLLANCAQRGDWSGGLRLFARCRDALQSTLGISPAPATLVLRDQLRAGSAAGAAQPMGS
jgi:ATP/maltotriose-dependent transcriptional regulator MalT/DNA-binding SARP family transcriptional activator